MPLAAEMPGEYYTREIRERMRLLAELMEAEKRAFAASPQFYSQVLSLRLMERRLTPKIRQARERMRLFAQRDMVRIYTAGARGSVGGRYKLNRFDIEEIKQMTDELESKIGQAFRQTQQDLVRVKQAWKIDLKRAATDKHYVRSHRFRILRDRISPKVDTTKYFATNLETVARRMGTTTFRANNLGFQTKTGVRGNQRKDWVLQSKAQRVKDVDSATREFMDWQLAGSPEVEISGRRWKFDTYFEMLTKTFAAEAYNRGQINALMRDKKVKAFLVSDGPNCGWLSHDDKQLANGMVVSPADAKAHPLAHPNCQRSFAPLFDVDKVPPRVNPADLKTKGRSRATAEWKAFQAGMALRARALPQIARGVAEQTARHLVSDLIADQNLRTQIFTRVIQSNPVMRTFDARVRGLANEIGRRLGREPSDREVADNVVKWIDNLLEGPQSQANPAYVQRILRGTVDANLRRVVNGPNTFEQRVTFKAMDDFTTYAELLNRRDMTHHMLNIVNSIEREYGTEWLKRIADTYGNRDAIQNAIGSFNGLYAPTRSKFTRTGRRSGVDLPEMVYRDIIKAGTDKYLPTTQRGRVSLVRLSSKEFRPDLLGLRFKWANRPLKIQTTTVNRNRYRNVGRLREVALQKGISIEEVVSRADGGMISDVLRLKRHSTLLDEIGYEAGFLTRITLNPTQLIRLGFKFDPSEGWKRPTMGYRQGLREPRRFLQQARKINRVTVLPQISVRTPEINAGPIRGMHLRYSAHLNKGFIPENMDRLVNSRRDPVRRGQQNMLNRLARQGVYELLPDGTRVRSVTQELNIAFGKTLDLGKVEGADLLGAPLMREALQNVTLRGNTFVGRMNNVRDAKDYLKRHGISGFREDMTFVSLIAEWRTMGWPWMRIGRVLHMGPDQIANLAIAVNRAWPTMRKEARMSTVVQRLYEGWGEMTDERRTSALFWTTMFEDELAGKVRFRNDDERRRALRKLVATYNKTGVIDIRTARRVRAYRRLLDGTLGDITR